MAFVTSCCSPRASGGDSLSRHGQVPGRDLAGAWAVQVLGCKLLRLDFELEEAGSSTVQRRVGVLSGCLRAVGASGEPAQLSRGSFKRGVGWGKEAFLGKSCRGWRQKDDWLHFLFLLPGVQARTPASANFECGFIQQGF